MIPHVSESEYTRMCFVWSILVLPDQSFARMVVTPEFEADGYCGTVPTRASAPANTLISLRGVSLLTVPASPSRRRTGREIHGPHVPLQFDGEVGENAVSAVVLCARSSRDLTEVSRSDINRTFGTDFNDFGWLGIPTADVRPVELHRR
jgi:hypothetical protein